MPFLPPNQQRQSTEGSNIDTQMRVLLALAWTENLEQVSAVANCYRAGSLFLVCEKNVFLQWLTD